MNQETNNLSFTSRLISIDLLRGLVIIIMALDHVRDFFGPTLFSPTDLSHTTTTLFLTRFITHFCAPVFVFLSGVSAYLYGRNRSRSQLSKFLITRGIWLIFLQMTLINFSWKFNLDKTTIWGIMSVFGASMIILSAIIWLPRPIILLIIVVTIFGHNSLDSLTFSDTVLKNIWYFLHIPGDINAGSWLIIVQYPIIPWFAIMSLGYYLGAWFKQPEEIRSKRFFFLGLCSLVIFGVLQYLNIYGDSILWSPHPDNLTHTILAFVNVTKYPPSLLYTLITLGTAFMILPLLEKWQSNSNKFVLCFGKVPLFFYLIHLYLIHIFAILYSRIVLNSPGGWWFGDASWLTTQQPWPKSYEANLIVVYIAWILLIIGTYPLCRMYQNYKSTHNYKWLSYL